MDSEFNPFAEQIQNRLDVEFVALEEGHTELPTTINSEMIPLISGPQQQLQQPSSGDKTVKYLPLPSSEIVFYESGQHSNDDNQSDTEINVEDMESDEENNGPRRFLQKVRSLSERSDDSSNSPNQLNKMITSVREFKGGEHNINRLLRPSSSSTAFSPNSIIGTDIFSANGKKDLAKLLECPICLEVTSVPVKLCERGHIVCNSCRNKSEKCPLCLGSYSQVRNYLAEELIKKCFAKCKYNSVGCAVRILESERFNHEKDCDFRPFECSLVGELHTCKRNLIRFEKFKSHILHGHQLKGVCSDYGEWFETATEMDLTLRTDQVNEFAYLECYDKLFLCASEVYDEKMIWWIYLVGTKSEAFMFEAEINITHLEKNISLSWQGPIHSIRMSSRDVFNSGLGLVVSPVNLRPLTTFLPATRKYEWVVGFHVIKKKPSNTLVL